MLTLDGPMYPETIVDLFTYPRGPVGRTSALATFSNIFLEISALNQIRHLGNSSLEM